MMNKATILLLISFFVCGLFSCREDNTASTLLDRADVLISVLPDSSLAILQQVEAPETLSERQYALWCLLFTQAQDKRGVTATSDSLIKVAVSYFEEEEDKYNLMKSYYYTAAVWFDMGDSPRAQTFFLKALDLAKETENNDFLGLIYINLGTIYLYYDILDAALDFEKKAAEKFFLLGDTANKVASMQNIGRIHIMNEQYDSALIYYFDILPFLTQYDSAFVYNEIGIIYEQKKDYDKSFEYVRRALSMHNTKEDSLYSIYRLGRLFQLSGNRDSAIYYLSQCIHSPNIDTRADAYLGLATVEEKAGNLVASTYYKEYIQLRDSINRTERGEYLHRTQSFFNYHEVEKESARYKQEAHEKKVLIYNLLLLLIVVAAISALIICYYRLGKQRESECREKERRDMIRERLEAKVNLEQVKCELNETSNALKEALDKAEEEHSVHKNVIISFYTGDIYKKLIGEEDDMSDDEWDMLEAFINCIYPGFTERLKAQAKMRGHTIDEYDLKICYMKKINFVKNKQIANLISVEPQTITNRWARLLKKVAGKDGSVADMNAFIANF